MHIHKISYPILIIAYLITGTLQAQTHTNRIQKALQTLEQNEAMQNAIYSLYVVNNKTGEIVFNKNGQYGLNPASCQKIITCVTAFGTR